MKHSWSTAVWGGRARRHWADLGCTQLPRAHAGSPTPPLISIQFLLSILYTFAYSCIMIITWYSHWLYDIPIQFPSNKLPYLIVPTPSWPWPGPMSCPGPGRRPGGFDPPQHPGLRTGRRRRRAAGAGPSTARGGDRGGDGAELRATKVSSELGRTGDVGSKGRGWKFLFLLCVFFFLSESCQVKILLSSEVAKTWKNPQDLQAPGILAQKPWKFHNVSQIPDQFCMQSSCFPQPVSVSRWFLNWWLGFDFMSFNSIYTSSSTHPGKLLHISLSLHVFPVDLGEIIVSVSCYWRDFRSLEHGAVGQRTSRAWNQRLGAAVARDEGRRAGKGLALPKNEGFHGICHGFAMICHSWWPWHQGKNDRRTYIIIYPQTWLSIGWYMILRGMQRLLDFFFCLNSFSFLFLSQDHQPAVRGVMNQSPTGIPLPTKKMQISRPQSFRWWIIV